MKTTSDTPMDSLTILVETLGGNCPVQAEGTINDHPFYFRGRHEQVSLSIAGPSGDVFGSDAWVHTDQNDDAGWLEDKIALDIIKAFAHIWLKTAETPSPSA